MEPASPDGLKKHQPIKKILLVNGISTTLVFKNQTFEITLGERRIKIIRDRENYATLTVKNQQVSYKATILGGFVLEEKGKGDSRYTKYFFIDWKDDICPPELYFKEQPLEIVRKYSKGQRVELGIDEVSGYLVVYRDGVEATFKREGNKGFTFSFSTGFYGSFTQLPDDSYTLTFKGDRLKPGEDDFRSQSKFIVTRSKYTGALLLILQDDATVNLK